VVNFRRDLCTYVLSLALEVVADTKVKAECCVVPGWGVCVEMNGSHMKITSALMAACTVEWVWMLLLLTLQ